MKNSSLFWHAICTLVEFTASLIHSSNCDGSTESGSGPNIDWAKRSLEMPRVHPRTWTALHVYKGNANTTNMRKNSTPVLKSKPLYASFVWFRSAPVSLCLLLQRSAVSFACCWVYLTLHALYNHWAHYTGCQTRLGKEHCLALKQIWSLFICNDHW